MRPTLDEIFAEPDIYGLLNVTAAAAPRSVEDADAAILQQVAAFREKHGRLPDAEADNHTEMRLGVIFRTLAKTPTHALRATDTFGLLQSTDEPPLPPPSWRDEVAEDDIPASLDDVFNDEALEGTNELFDLQHVTLAAERHLPVHRADFIVCPDFDLFEPRFQEIQAELEIGGRVAKPIKSRMIIEPFEGDFFIRNGLLAFIAEKSEMTAKAGARDYRLRVIYSNGTESDPLASSFRKSLNEDKTARMVQRQGLGALDPEWEGDKLALSGTIYVAKSLSTDPAIAAQRNILHKIGVTSQEVRRRIADARNDPTFLLAPVEVVATYALQNLPRARVEELLHRFFAAARPAELFILDRFGRRVSPREWFYVLPEHVSHAAALLNAGDLHRFQYDPSKQAIVPKA